MYNFDLYNVFLTIATNIPQWLKTAFVVQGHILLKQVGLKTVLLSTLVKDNCLYDCIHLYMNN